MPLTRWFRLIGVLLSLATVLLVGRLAALEWAQLRQAERALAAVQQLRLALAAAEMVSRERGPSNGVLGEEAPASPARREALAQARDRTDQTWRALRAALPDTGADTRHQLAGHQLDHALGQLREARATLDQVAGRPKAQRSPEALRDSVRGMVALVPLLAPTVSLLADDAQQAVPALSDAVTGARLAAELREYAGLLGSLFTPALTRQQPFTAEELSRIEQVRGRIEQLHFLLDLQVRLSPETSPVRQAVATMETHYFGSAGALLTEVLATGQRDGRFGMDPAAFAARYVPDMNAIFSVRDALLDEARQRAQTVHDEARQTLLVAGLAALALLTLVLAVMRLVQRRIISPLAGSAQVLHAMAQGDLAHPVPTPLADDEIGAVLGGISALQRHAQERHALERERDELIDRLRDQSNTDFLTGLPNRRAFFNGAEREIARARRHGYGLVLVLMDIDHFKQVNDHLGHAGGDEALVAVATVLRRALRQGDLAARIGGEEFVALLGHCDAEQGLRFAERLREAIAGLSVSSGDTALHLTVSLGLAELQPGEPALDELLSRADEALYAAKAAGRNRSLLAGAARPQPAG